MCDHGKGDVSWRKRSFRTKPRPVDALNECRLIIPKKSKLEIKDENFTEGHRLPQSKNTHGPLFVPR